MNHDLKNTPQPGSIFITLDAFGNLKDSAESLDKRHPFGDYIRSTVARLLEDEPIPDHWMFRMDFPDRKTCLLFSPPLNPKFRKHPMHMIDRAFRAGASVSAAVRLRDAAFCLTHGIDPLSEQGKPYSLQNHPDYIAGADRYGAGIHCIRSGQAVFPSFWAVESAQGILLFSTSGGLEACLQSHANAFFNGDYTTEKLRVWAVAPLSEEARSKAEAFSLVGDSRVYASSELPVPPAGALASAEILRGAVCEAEYDMKPTYENFTRFLTSRRYGQLHITRHNHKILQLLGIEQRGEITPQFNRLDWIGTTLARMAVPQVREKYTGEQLKKIAAALRKEIYPGIRCEGIQEQTHAESMKARILPLPARRAVPAIPQNPKIKRTANL